MWPHIVTEEHYFFIRSCFPELRVSHMWPLNTYSGQILCSVLKGQMISLKLLAGRPSTSVRPPMTLHLASPTSGGRQSLPAHFHSPPELSRGTATPTKNNYVNAARGSTSTHASSRLPATDPSMQSDLSQMGESCKGKNTTCISSFKLL